MIIEKPKGIEDLKECIKMYMEYDQQRFFKHDAGKSMINMQKNLTNGSQLRLIRMDGKIIAWILFRPFIQEFSGERVVQQYFYCSNTTKLKSVKCLVALHNEMIEWGRKMGIKTAISMCSHEDTSFQLCRILAREGWSTCGFLAKVEI